MHDTRAVFDINCLNKPLTVPTIRSASKIGDLSKRSFFILSKATFFDK